jgi:hypothetical protein
MRASLIALAIGSAPSFNSTHLGAQESTKSPADNTKTNQRDRSKSEATADQAKNNASDHVDSDLSSINDLRIFCMVFGGRKEDRRTEGLRGRRQRQRGSTKSASNLHISKSKTGTR